MSQTRRLDQIPQAATVTLGDRIAIWQDGRTRIGTVADLLAGLLPVVPDLPAVTASQAALIAILDSLPALPADPANYPSAGGLFRNGDATGYGLTRLYPKV